MVHEEETMEQMVLNQLVNSHDYMRKLIGRPVRYADKAYEICDVIFDENLLILSTSTSDTMQDDSYGRPHRKVPGYQSLPFRDADGKPAMIWDKLAFLDGKGALE